MLLKKGIRTLSHTYVNHECLHLSFMEAVDDIDNHLPKLGLLWIFRVSVVTDTLTATAESLERCSMGRSSSSAEAQLYTVLGKRDTEYSAVLRHVVESCHQPFSNLFRRFRRLSRPRLEPQLRRNQRLAPQLVNFGEHGRVNR